MNFTQKEIDKLLRYLETNAELLASGGKISDTPYYPGRPELDSYRWIFIEIDGLGIVKLYYTSASEVVVINNVGVERTLIKSKALINAWNSISREYNKYKASQTKSWFKDK